MRSKLPSLTIKPLLACLILFIFIAVLAKLQLRTSPPLSTQAPLDVFSSERAFNMLEELISEQIPHPVDSSANRLVEERLVNKLRGMGYQEEIQDTQVCHDNDSGSARCTRVRNIIVNIPGSEADNGILLSAHYDSVPASPGGSDAGAAVATLLETARLLTLSAQPRNSIVLLFNEGEEFGLFGAKAFMEQHPLARTLQLALNVEARGSAGKSVMFETGENSGWLVNQYAKTSPSPVSSSLFYEVYKFLPNNTDLTIFKDHGLQGLNFAHAENLPHYHTPLDNLKNLNRGSLQEHGDNVWGVLSQIKDMDLNNVEAGNLVYTDVMGFFVVQWSEPASMILSISALTLFILITFLSSKKRLIKISNIFRGVLASVVILAMSAFAGFLVKFLTQTLSDSRFPWYSHQLPMQLALWLGVLFFALLCGRWIVKKANALEVLLALTAGWILLSLTTSIMMPGISFLFIIPAVVSIVGVTFLLWLVNSNTKSSLISALYKTVFICIAVVCAVMFFPVAYALEILVGYQMSIAIGLVLGFAASQLLPLVSTHSGNNTSFNASFNVPFSAPFRTLLYATASFSLISIGWTSLQSTYTQWMPQQINLNYLQHPNGTATMIKGHRGNNLPKSLANALPKETQLTTPFPWSPWPYYTAPVETQNITPPQVRLTTNNLKTVRLDITNNPINLSDVMVFVPVDSTLKSIQSKSHTINYLGDKQLTHNYYLYHCRGESCAEMALTLDFEQHNPTKIIVSSIYHGLPEQLQYLQLLRGNTAVPYQGGDQSIIYVDISLH